MSRASLDKPPAEVAAMFDAVSPRYDRTNDVLALGQNRRWRKLVLEAAGVGSGAAVLDIAAGTGTSSLPFRTAGARVVSADFSLGMLRQGRRQYPQLTFAAADATALPFADGVFDAVTMSFGLRNVVDVPAALREFARVTRPGGRLVICEFSRPTNPVFRSLYYRYLIAALPPLARLFSADPESYRYLVESIREWPSQRDLAQLIRAAGWRQVAWRNVSGGVVALHRAVAEQR